MEASTDPPAAEPTSTSSAPAARPRLEPQSSLDALHRLARLLAAAEGGEAQVTLAAGAEARARVDTT